MLLLINPRCISSKKRWSSMSEEVHSRGASNDTSCTDCATLLSELASKIQRSCAEQRAHTSTASFGSWRFVAADCSGHPHPIFSAQQKSMSTTSATSMTVGSKLSFCDYDGCAAEARPPKLREVDHTRFPQPCTSLKISASKTVHECPIAQDSSR